MADTLGKLNPFRYRGYVYDAETGIYYVSSRYYDPKMGRWISSEPNIDSGEFDEGSEILGYNVYAGAILGGAIGGAVLGSTGNVNLANAVAGATTTGIGMSLEKLTGCSDK